MDRREFITWMGAGGLAASLPVAIAACTSQSPPANTSETTPSISDGTRDAAGSEGEVIGTVSQLDVNQQLLNADAGVGPVLVIRAPDNPDTLLAVNPTCPHSGCIVGWQSNRQRFVCPCHDSQFSADGAITQGPAEESLATYTVEIKDSDILVTGS
jgi:cytochrome b6-f complex iron-sulfur subunit